MDKKEPRLPNIHHNPNFPIEIKEAKLEPRGQKEKKKKDLYGIPIEEKKEEMPGQVVFKPGQAISSASFTINGMPFNDIWTSPHISYVKEPSEPHDIIRQKVEQLQLFNQTEERIDSVLKGQEIPDYIEFYCYACSDERQKLRFRYLKDIYTHGMNLHHTDPVKISKEIIKLLDQIDKHKGR